MTETIRVDPADKRVLVGGDAIYLTPMQWRIFARLWADRGHVVGADDLAAAAWYEGDVGPVIPEDRENVRWLISRLRRQLGADAITTRSGFGYILEREETERR